MSKSLSDNLQDDDEITYELTASEDNKRVTLVIIAPKNLTGEDYFTALSCFIDDHYEDADMMLCNKELSSSNMH